MVVQGELQNYYTEQQNDLVAGQAVQLASTVPPPPTAPAPGKKVLELALLVGLLVGCGLALVTDRLDDRLRSLAELVEIGDVALLAELPTRPAGGRSTFVTADSHDELSEAVRELRTALRFLSVDKPLRTLLVTSASPGEGKSFVAANLAVALAVSGARTILVSSDLRRPRLESLLESAPSSRGLSEAIADAALTAYSATNTHNGAGPAPRPRVDLDRLLVMTGVENLLLVPAGASPPNPAELLGSSHMASLIGALKAESDIVILDSPPVLAVTDALVLTAHADGVLVVMAKGRTSRARRPPGPAAARERSGPRARRGAEPQRPARRGALCRAPEGRHQPSLVPEIVAVAPPGAGAGGGTRRRQARVAPDPAHTVGASALPASPRPPGAVRPMISLAGAGAADARRRPRRRVGAQSSPVGLVVPHEHLALLIGVGGLVLGVVLVDPLLLPVLAVPATLLVQRLGGGAAATRPVRCGARAGGGHRPAARALGTGPRPGGRRRLRRVLRGRPPPQRRGQPQRPQHRRVGSPAGARGRGHGRRVGGGRPGSGPPGRPLPASRLRRPGAADTGARRHPALSPGTMGPVSEELHRVDALHGCGHRPPQPAVGGHPPASGGRSSTSACSGCWLRSPSRPPSA